MGLATERACTPCSTCSPTPSRADGDRTALSLRLDDGSTTSVDLSRARSPLADRRLAAARARARARRPAPDLVALDAGAAGHLLRGDAGRPDPRAARPAHVGRRGRRRSSGRRAPATWSWAPAATRRIRARPASSASRRPRSTRSPPSRTRPSPPDWEAQLARLAARRRPDEVFELVFTSGHDRHARRA